MDNYNIFLIKKASQLNITPICANLSWGDSLDTLGMQFNFDIARSTQDRYLRIYDVAEIGDKIVLKNNDIELFRGITVDLSTEISKKVITAFDYAFYLNQSKVIIQFNKIIADVAIKQLCSKFNIPIGNITSIPTIISKIYNGQTVSDIIKDILDQVTKETGMKFRLEMREGKLYIEKYEDLLVEATFKPAANIQKFSVFNAIGNISKSESIQEMRNRIQISSGDERSSKVIASADDPESIAAYGLLQEVESIDNKDIAQARNVANNRLKELNRIKQNITLDLLGDDKIRSGRIVTVNNDQFGLSGNYLVKECTHTYHNSIRKMNITIEKV